MMKKFPGILDLFGITLIFLLFSLIAGGIMGVVMLLTDASQTMMMALVFPIPLVAAIFGGILMNMARDKEDRANLKFDFSFKKEWIPLLAACIALAIAVGMTLEPLMALFPQRWFDEMNAMFGRGIWTIITVVVLAPVLEEMLLRGIVLKGALQRYCPMAAILISAALFGIFHMSLLQGIPGFFIGIVLGFVFWKTGSLIPVMIIHAVNNAIAYLCMTATMPDGSVPQTTREALGSDWLYWPLYGVCVALTVAGGIYIWRELRKKEEAA